jgi:hypothetical protein
LSFFSEFKNFTRPGMGNPAIKSILHHNQVQHIVPVFFWVGPNNINKTTLPDASTVLRPDWISMCHLDVICCCSCLAICASRYYVPVCILWPLGIVHKQIQHSIQIFGQIPLPADKVRKLNFWFEGANKLLDAVQRSPVSNCSE